MVKPPVLSPGLLEDQGSNKESGKNSDAPSTKPNDEKETGKMAEDPNSWKKTEATKFASTTRPTTKKQDKNLNDIKFFLDIPNPDKTNIVNIAEEHYLFLSAVFVADPNAKFYPTVNTEDPDRKTTPFISVIDTIDNFPKCDKDHRSFFHHYMIKKNRKVRIEERLVTHLTMREIRDNTFSTLKNRKLWITNDELKRIETTIVGYIFYSDGPMTHIQTLERDINALINDFNLNDEQKARIQDYHQTDDITLPGVIIRLRDLPLGNHQRILTEALFIRAPKFLGSLYKEILSAGQVQKREEIQGEFVPAGAVNSIGEDNFKKMMLANNDHNNNIQAIQIFNASETFLKATFANGSKITTVNDFLLETPGVRSIQPTNKSTEFGKYFVVVNKHAIKQAKGELHLRINHAEKSTSYERVFPRAPKIAAGFAPDSSAHQLCFEFKKNMSEKPTVEEMLKNENPQPVHNAWNRPIFDLRSTSETPASIQDAKSTQSIAMSEATKSGILKHVNFEEGTKTPTTQSQVSEWDDKSIGSTVSQLTQSIAQLESVTQSMAKLAEAQAKQVASQQTLFETAQAAQSQRLESVEAHIMASDAKFEKMFNLFSQMVPKATSTKRAAEVQIEKDAEQKKVNASMEEH